MKIILARHAETGASYRGRYIGVSDPPISVKGREQAVDLARRLRQYDINQMLVSPLLRTRQTAAAILDRRQLPWREESRLREIDFGRWEGMTFAEITALYPKEVERWGGAGGDFSFPGGEQVRQFWARISSLAQEMVSMDGPLLALTHGGVTRALICEFLGLELTNYLLFDVAPGRFAVLDIYSEGGVLRGLNL